VEGVRPRGRPKTTWSGVLSCRKRFSQTRQLCKEHAVDHNEWRKLVKDIAADTDTGCYVFLVPAHPRHPR